jgi:hypothetical protein
MRVMLAQDAGRVALASPRIRATVVAAVLAVGAIATALVIRNPQPAGTVHHDPRLDVSARIPEGWHIQSFDDRVGFATHTGFVVSNVAHDFRHPRGQAVTTWDLSDLPPHAVVIDISRIIAGLDVGGGQAGGPPATDFPLSLDRFRSYTKASQFGVPPRLYFRVLLEDGSDFGVHVWFLPEASDHDRDLAEDLISSIEPAQ